MTPEVAVRTRLIEDATVYALVGTRIYPDVLPQSPTLPAVVYFRASALPDGLTQDRRIGPEQPRIQIDAWATTRAQTDQVYSAVKAALHGNQWTTADGDRVHLVTHETDNDLAPSEDASPEPGVTLTRRSTDYRVVFRKAS